ncbi:hypothetical protein C1N77_18405 [Geobacillus thermoleovorans]
MALRLNSLFGIIGQVSRVYLSQEDVKICFGFNLIWQTTKVFQIGKNLARKVLMIWNLSLFNEEVFV